MKFICYTDWSQLPESANALFTQAEKDSIFFSRPWFENLSAIALDADHTLVFASVVENDKVLAILPLMKCAGKSWYSLKHRYTSLYSLLLENDNQQEILSCLCQGLSELPVSAFLLEPVADNDNKLNKFIKFMEAAGFSCDRMFRHYNWIYHVQKQSFDEYIAARPAKLRNTISRKKRKLEREHTYDIRLFTGDEVPAHMSDYHAIYTASWKANEQYVDFLDGIVTRFSKQGWSRLVILYINGQPAAAQLWFVVHAKANIFRLAYDETWKAYSPGSILTSFLMEYVINVDKVEEIDFLTGNDTYKQDWMSERRERFALSCVKKVKRLNKYKKLIKTLKYILKKILVKK